MYSCDHVQAGGFSCQERVATHAHVTAPVKLQSHDRSRDAVGEDASRRGGTSVGEVVGKASPREERGTWRLPRMQRASADGETVWILAHRKSASRLT